MKKSLLFSALFALPLAVSAEGLSYNYVQANWIFDSEVDAGNLGSDEGDGFDIGGVFSFSDMLYVLGEYKDLSGDDGGDLQDMSFGVGAHSNAYTGGIDVFGNLTYEDIEVDIGNGNSADDSGFGIEIGARTALTANADAYISYDYSDAGDIEGSFFKIGGSWAFNPNWAVTAEYMTGDYEVDVTGFSGDADRDDMRIGLRYNF